MMPPPVVLLFSKMKRQVASALAVFAFVLLTGGMACMAWATTVWSEEDDMGEMQIWAEPDEAPPDVPLEVELKLLQAEMAAVSEDWKTVRRLLPQLRQPLKGTSLEQRWRVVWQLLQEADGHMTPMIRLRMSWPFDLKGRYVVMLPLSGPLEAASREILAQLKKLPDFQPLDVLDTESMDMDSLQRTVALLSPDWVLGPLRPSRLEAWLETGASWPVFSFAPVRENCLYCYSVTTDAQQQLALQRDVLEDGARNWLVTDERFYSARHTDYLPERVLTTLIGKRVDRAIRYALNVPKSQGRYNWMVKQLGRSGVHFTPRVRQDLDRVLIVLPAIQAYQVRTLLDYWGLIRPVYWLPRPLLTREQVRKMAREWPDTHVFLPPFLFDETYPSGQLGIFRALGETAGAVLNATQEALQVGIDTPLGRAQLVQNRGLVVRYPLMELRSQQWKKVRSEQE